MANIATEVLFARLMRSGLAEQVVNDVFRISGIEVEILDPSRTPDPEMGGFVVPLFVGKVKTATIKCPGGLPADRRKALRRVLEMVAEALGQPISLPAGGNHRWGATRSGYGDCALPSGTWHPGGSQPRSCG